MYECQEVSKKKKLEMRTKIKEKSLTSAGLEPTTS